MANGTLSNVRELIGELSPQGTLSGDIGIPPYILRDETDPVFTESPAYEITDNDIANWNNKSDFSGSYNDLTNKPTIPTVPTDVSDFNNDAGYISEETDPTVPSWAKQENKPTYTATEVGALPYDTPIPTKTSDLINDSDFVTSDDASLVSWEQIADSGTVIASISINGIETDVYAPSGGGDVSDVQINGTSIVSGGVAEIPTADGTTFGVAKIRSLSGSPHEYYLKIETDNEYKVPLLDNNERIKAGYLPEATTSVRGAMSSADKVKLNGVSAGANSVSWTQDVSTGTKIASINIDGTSTDVYAPNNGIPYYTCDSPANNAIKYITPVSGSIGTLSKGTSVLVKFTNSNTANFAMLTDDLDASGYPYIRRGNSNVGTTEGTSWSAGAVVMFTYDGTYWQLNDWQSISQYDNCGAPPKPSVRIRNDYTPHYPDVSKIELPLVRDNGTISAYFIPEATTSVRGAMSSADKVKLNGISAGAEANVQSNWNESNTSSDAYIQNKPTIPSKTSDLTNDQIYDLGTITLDNNGIFTLTTQQVNDIVAMWNRGFCAVKCTVDGADYYAFRERIITFNDVDFYGFVNTNAYVQGGFTVESGKVIVGISQVYGIGMFGRVRDITNEDVSIAIETKQDILVSGSNIKTINGNSVLGSGNLSTSEIFIAVYGTTTQADILSAYQAGKAVFCKNGSVFYCLHNANAGTCFFSRTDDNKFYGVYIDANGWHSYSYTAVVSSRKINNHPLSSDITLTASDVGALSNTTAIPTKTSDLTNDAGFLTLATLPIYDGSVI